MRTISGLAALALALAACGTGTEQGAYSEIRQSLSGITRLGRPEAPARVTASDAALNAAPSNILLVEVPDRGTQAGLVLNAVNRDTITWRSGGGADVVTRGGQLVRTAGFGNDLTSAAVPDIGAGQGRVVRDLYHLAGNEKIVRTRYICTLRTEGVQNITVTGRQFETVLITERCRSDDGPGIENRYWIDGFGIVRQSRQFAGERIGYLEMKDVHTGLR